MSFFADIETGFWVVIAIIWGLVKLVDYFSNENSDSSQKTKDAKHSTGKRVQLNYINATGNHRSSYVNSETATRHGDRVRVNLYGSLTRMELVYDRIKNPEVIGMGRAPSSVAVSKDCPSCNNAHVRPWDGKMRCWNCGHVLTDQTPEPLPPVLPVLPKGEYVTLQYMEGTGKREIPVNPEAYWNEKNNVQCVRADTGNTINLDPHRIVNPEDLMILNPDYATSVPPVELPEDEEEPPILEPKALKLGELTGRELIYTQKSGQLAVIYFDPATVEQIGNFVNLSPMGIDERYAIAMRKIVNPEVLEADPEPKEEEELPPVLAAPEPDVIEPKIPEGTRVQIRRVPTDSYEAVQVMRRIKPKLNTFEIFELLDQEKPATLTGYDDDEAIRVGCELEAVGCRVDIKREEQLIA